MKKFKNFSVSEFCNNFLTKYGKRCLNILMVVTILAWLILVGLKIYDIHLQAYPSEGSGLSDKYAEQRFVERYPPWSTGEKKILQYALHLNDTFFSNYYHTDFAYNNEIPYYLTNSQRRIRVKIRNASISSLWYLYKYYIESQDSIWKLVAISYDVRKNMFALTLHNNIDF